MFSKFFLLASTIFMASIVSIVFYSFYSLYNFYRFYGCFYLFGFYSLYGLKSYKIENICILSENQFCLFSLTLQHQKLCNIKNS